MWLRCCTTEGARSVPLRGRLFGAFLRHYGGCSPAGWQIMNRRGGGDGSARRGSQCLRASAVEAVPTA